MQRIMVDLPEPDGPQMTMRSPPITLRSMSRSTWKSPYHLLTRSSSTATAVLSLVGLMRLVSLIASPFLAGGQPRFHGPRIARHAVAERQVEHRRHRVAGGRGHRRCPFRIDARHFDGAQEVEDADDEHQCRILEQADIGVDDVRDGDLERLR